MILTVAFFGVYFLSLAGMRPYVARRIWKFPVRLLSLVVVSVVTILV